MQAANQRSSERRQFFLILRDFFRESLDEIFRKEMLLMQQNISVRDIALLEVNDFELYYDRTVDRINEENDPKSEGTN